MKLLSRTLLDELAAKAAASPRARAHYNIHATPADPVQRFVVVASGDSYFRPHRHATRSELAVIVRGRLDVLTFDGHGRVTARYAVGEGTDALPTKRRRAPGTRSCRVRAAAHSSRSRRARTIRPLRPNSPPGRPAEGHASVPKFLEWLRRAQPGDTPPA